MSSLLGSGEQNMGQGEQKAGEGEQKVWEGTKIPSIILYKISP